MPVLTSLPCCAESANPLPSLGVRAGGGGRAERTFAGSPHINSAEMERLSCPESDVPAGQRQRHHQEPASSLWPLSCSSLISLGKPHTGLTSKEAIGLPFEWTLGGLLGPQQETERHSAWIMKVSERKNQHFARGDEVKGTSKECRGS